MIRFGLSLLIGFLLGLSNLYSGLKIGFTVGVAILTVFCWALADAGLRRFFPRITPLDRHDYVCYASLSSAMSYGCGTVIATALSALLLGGSADVSPWILTLWVVGMCGLGTCLALPLRQQMLSTQPFPSGRVAAETIRQMETQRDLKPFLIAALLAGAWSFFSHFSRESFSRIQLYGEQFYLQLSPFLVGLGALLGLRTCLSMWLGAWTFFLVVPTLFGDGEQIGEFSLWFAIGMIMAASLSDFFLSFREMARGGSWFDQFLGGFSTGVSYYVPVLLCCLLTVWLVSVFGLEAPPLTTLLVLSASIFVAQVACRITGETDVVPTGSLGKLSLLFLGFFHPGQLSANMVSTGTLTASSASSADFMTDLRCGADLGCPVERQFAYQLAGALLGPVLFVPVFFLLISGDQPLGGETFPAPAAQIWLRVASLSDPGTAGGGFIYPMVGWGVLVGGGAHLLSRRYSWFPSTIAFSLAVVLDWGTTTALLLGAVLATRIPATSGYKIWCALIAADSAANVILGLF